MNYKMNCELLLGTSISGVPVGSPARHARHLAYSIALRQTSKMSFVNTLFPIPAIRPCFYGTRLPEQTKKFPAKVLLSTAKKPSHFRLKTGLVQKRSPRNVFSSFTFQVDFTGRKMRQGHIESVKIVVFPDYAWVRS